MRHPSPDARLRDEILRDFRAHPMLDDTRLDVEVDDGVVTVVGTAASIAEKLTAEGVADAVDGVRDVLSRLDVKPSTAPARRDDELATMARSVLAWDALVPEQGIEVDVHDAWLTMRGTVSIASQAEEAARAVRHLVGLRGITNELELAQPPVSPELIRSVIGEVLARRARHRARRVDVIVDDRIVVLRGTAESAGQRRAIHQAVAHAPGVDTVIDELVPEESSGGLG
ncbi:MAG: BON domain-containing protein [Actinomycetota bacterium]